MALSHKVLRRAYLRFNAKWFDGRLPESMEVLFTPLDGETHACCILDRASGAVESIKIDPMYAVCIHLWKQSLLHEMAHVASGDYTHGARFNKEISRLFKAGAYRGLL